MFSGMRGLYYWLPGAPASHETVEIPQDKFGLNSSCERNGFKVPETRHVEDVKQLPEIFAELGGGENCGVGPDGDRDIAEHSPYAPGAG